VDIVELVIVLNMHDVFETGAVVVVIVW